MLYFDIETCPDMSIGALERHIFEVEPPGQYKKAESIAEWKAANGLAAGRESWQKTALNALHGGIYVIGIADDEGREVMFQRDPRHDSELDLLTAAFAYLKLHHSKGARTLDRLIGWNICGFDLPYVARRAAINGLESPVLLPVGKRWDSSEVTDLMQVWAGGDRQQWAGQRKVALAMGLEVGPEMDWGAIWADFTTARLHEVVEHCQDDVRTLRAIHQRMRSTFNC